MKAETVFLNQKKILVIRDRDFKDGISLNKFIGGFEGDFIFFYHEDSPEKAEKLLSPLLSEFKNGKTGIVYGKYELPGAYNLKKIFLESDFPDNKLVFTLENIYRYGYRAYFINPGLCLFSMEAYKNCGPFLPVTEINPLFAFSSQCIFRGYEVLYLPDIKTNLPKETENFTSCMFYYRFGKFRTMYAPLLGMNYSLSSMEDNIFSKTGTNSAMTFFAFLNRKRIVIFDLCRKKHRRLLIPVSLFKLGFMLVYATAGRFYFLNTHNKD